MNKEFCDKMEGKLEKLDNRLDKIDRHLAVYNEQLNEHMRRTHLLEVELKPVRDHVVGMRAFVKAFAITSTVLGVILSLLKLSGII